MSLIPRIKTHPMHVYGALYPLWLSAMTLIRSSVIFLYTRIFPIRWFRLTCYSILVINIVCCVVLVVSHSVAQFNRGCLQEEATDCMIYPELKDWAEVLALIFNLSLDVVVVVLPVPTLWRLQIPISKKLMLSGMFGLGIM